MKLERFFFQLQHNIRNSLDKKNKIVAWHLFSHI